ncbi:MAG TPA: glycosyltransferase [Puia sp.]|nr:glycosyltransferase [Puia sp.]
MKVLIAGSDEVWSLEKYYGKNMGEAGVEVSSFPAQSIFYGYYQKSIIHKLLFKCGLSPVRRMIESQMRQMVEDQRPDIVWVFKGMELAPDLLRWIKGKGVRLVNYNPDNPFLFSGKGSGNTNVTASIPLYDLHFSYDRSVCQRISRDYNIPCGILPFGFELAEGLYADCQQQEETVKLCFLGNPDKQRAAFISQLADQFPVDVFGFQWEKFVRHQGITVFPPVYGEAFWKTLRRYRVQLNLMRPHNLHSHNMRTFEVPGVGGIGLFPRTADHETFFEPGKEVFLYGDMAECKQQAAALLALTPGQAAEIRQAARRRSLGSGYTYRDRALQALTEMKKLLG